MEFLNEILGPNMQKTRDPKRKFAAKEYFEEINRYTKLLDLRLGKTLDMEAAVNKYGIIDVQLLDFAGSVFIDRDGEIKPGLNLLFQRNEMNKDTELLHHKVHLVRFMRKFNHKAAMVEYDQIMKFGEAKNDKFTEFRYICLKGRILMRWRKLEDSKKEFEKAFTLLETNYSKEERDRLISERFTRMEPVFENPNWDSYLIDYDEIFVIYLYSLNLNWMGKYEADYILKLIEDGISMSQNYNLIYDLISFYQLISEIYENLGLSDKAENNIRFALKQFSSFDMTNELVEIYADITQSLIYILSKNLDFDAIEIEINKFVQKADIEKNEIAYRNYLLFQLYFNTALSKMSETFKILGLIVEHYHKSDNTTYGFERLIISKYLFQYILQGFYLGIFTEQKDIAHLVKMNNQISKLAPAGKIYTKLLQIRSKYLNQQFGITNSSYLEIKQEYEKHLRDTESDESIFYTALTQFLDFYVRQMDVIDRAIDDISKLIESYNNKLLSSKYVSLTIKLIVILELIRNNQNTVIEWLRRIETNYDSKNLHKLINELVNIISNLSNKKQIFSKIIDEEIYQLKFENHLDVPINQKIL